MKQLFLLLFFTSFYGVYAQQTIEEQLLLKFDENYITQLKDVNAQLYDFYVTELLNSFEFVILEDNVNYPVLEAYDFHNQVAKEAPYVTNSRTFCLYNYRFERYPNQDVIYRIPNSEKTDFGVKIYSKENFNKKL